MISLCRYLLLVAIVLAGQTAFGAGGEVYWGNNLVQGYACDPDKHLGTIPSGTVLEVGPGGDHNIRGWRAVAFWPSADGTVAYNGDANKTEPIYGGQRNVIVIHWRVTRLVPTAPAIACGM